MSAVAVLVLALGVLLIYSAITNQPLFVGPNARVAQVLKGAK